MVGTDQFGNKYFENNRYFYGRNRWVEYAPQFGTLLKILISCHSWTCRCCRRRLRCESSSRGMVRVAPLQNWFSSAWWSVQTKVQMDVETHRKPHRNAASVRSLQHDTAQDRTLDSTETILMNVHVLNVDWIINIC